MEVWEDQWVTGRPMETGIQEDGVDNRWMGEELLISRGPVWVKQCRAGSG